MKKIFSIMFLLLGLTLFIVSCGEKKDSSKAKIGLVVSTLNNPFFVELRDGAVKEAANLGYDLVVLDSQDNVAKELSNVEDLISSKVSAILINPTDSDASAKAAKLAVDKGIIVISLDRNINGVEVKTHIASDNAAGGAMAADYLKTFIKNTDKIVELEGIPGTSAARERGRGFNESLAKDGYKVAIKQTANFDRSQGLTVAENILQANKDTKAIFAHNDEMALGAQKASEAQGLNILIIGFDATPDAVSAVESGKLVATVAQQPSLIGSLGVVNAVKAINNETIDTSIPVELKLVVKQ